MNLSQTRYDRKKDFKYDTGEPLRYQQQMAWLFNMRQLMTYDMKRLCDMRQAIPPLYDERYDMRQDMPTSYDERCDMRHAVLSSYCKQSDMTEAMACYMRQVMPYGRNQDTRKDTRHQDTRREVLQDTNYHTELPHNINVLNRQVSLACYQDLYPVVTFCHNASSNRIPNSGILGNR